MDRNVIIALVLSTLLLFGYEALVLGPKRAAYLEAQEKAQAIAAEQMDPADAGETFLPGTERSLSREQALAEGTARLPIETPTLSGSVNLEGLLFDDLILKTYRATLAADSPPIVLLSPRTATTPQFMRAGLSIGGVSDRTARWQAPEGAVLTPKTPVIVTRQEGDIQYRATLAVDEQFMFRVTYEVTNGSGETVVAQPYGAAYQRGIPADLQNFMILFEGPIGVVDHRLMDRKYKKLLSGGGIEDRGSGGWVGITDKYWLSAAIPPQDTPFKAELDVTDGAIPLFRASYLLETQSIAPGATIRTEAYLYGGSKEVEVLRMYQDQLGIDRFVWAVDWGHFSFLTRPIFGILAFFEGLTGNWGVAILLLTLVIKAVLFPLANMSYKSMAGMKKVQPELMKIRERYTDDKTKQQQEMMALYKKHKINPAAGCLPVLAQMPIFYALYKTLFVTIELRHEPFLYIPDLSEQDPTSVFNLFGLLPFDPTTVPLIGSFLGIGILPLLMGAAMFVQLKLNPPPPDPTQRMIFGLMPLIFMFIFAPFAAGLVLYWFWNTFLSVIQQYIIMKRQGADVDILGNIKQSFGKAPQANDNKA